MCATVLLALENFVDLLLDLLLNGLLDLASCNQKSNITTCMTVLWRSEYLCSRHHQAPARHSYSGVSGWLIQDHAVGTHRLVAQEVGADEVCVDDSGSVVLGGSKAPDEEDELASVVEGEPGEQQVCARSKLKSSRPSQSRAYMLLLTREKLEEREGGVHDPVRQPLSVVLLIVSLDGLEFPVRQWISYAARNMALKHTLRER